MTIFEHCFHCLEAFLPSPFFLVGFTSSEGVASSDSHLVSRARRRFRLYSIGISKRCHVHIGVVEAAPLYVRFKGEFAGKPMEKEVSHVLVLKRYRCGLAADPSKQGAKGRIKWAENSTPSEPPDWRGLRSA